jgi:tripartite-type tricarboxylate transporter receptor subunit TctC
MTELLDTKPGDAVLEIGTGSGYQAAVLAELVASVYSIEIIEPVGTNAAALLKQLGYTNIHTRIGDGYNGWPERAPFDAIRDFAPVTQLTQSPNVWLVTLSFAGQTMKDLVDNAKAKPRQIDYASSGVGSMQHLGGELLKRSAGVDIQHVPYKGTGALLPDLLAGRVSLAFENVTVMTPYIKSGALRPLAVTSSKRSPVLPDVMTMIEAGLPNFEVIGWFGIFTAARTPPETIERLNAQIAAIMKESDVRERMLAQGAEPLSGPAGDLRDLLAREIDVWGKVIREAAIRLD